MLANAGGGRYACHMSIRYVDSPVGRLAVEAHLDAVTSVRWAGTGERARDASASPLLEEAARHIARYKLPKAFVFVPEIVRSPSGKADYRWAKQTAVDAAS